MAYLSTSLDCPPSAVQDEAIRFHFFKFQLADYIVGTRGMELAHEGAYIRFLVLLYENGRAFPDDDRAMARRMDLDIRVWRRMRATLIEAGKIQLRSGCLTNRRFEDERLKRAEDMRKKAAAARARWDGSPELVRDFRETSAGSPKEVPQKVGKKPNEINESGQILHMPLQNFITTESKKEENTYCADAQLPLGDVSGRRGLSAAAAIVAAGIAAVTAAPAAAAEPPEPTPVEQTDRGPAFDEFWSAYPNKSGKAKAKERWAKLSGASRRAAIAALPAYRSCGKVQRGFVLQGDTYLSKRTWEDFGVSGGAGPQRDAYRYTGDFRTNGQPWDSEWRRWKVENDERSARGESLMAPLPEYADA